MSTPHDVYDNPLIGRYASAEMAERWGPLRKFRTWRRLWLALAEAEAELGLPADDGSSPRIRPERSARLVDISEGGVCVETAAPLQPDGIYDLILRLDAMKGFLQGQKDIWGGRVELRLKF